MLVLDVIGMAVGAPALHLVNKALLEQMTYSQETSGLQNLAVCKALLAAGYNNGKKMHWYQHLIRLFCM